MHKIGDYIFDEDLAHVVAPSGDIDELSPLSFKLLSYLVKNNHRLVPKQELIKNIWGHHVSDSSVNKSISILRKTFADSSAVQGYVATRKKLGYRIVATIIKIEPIVLEQVKNDQTAYSDLSINSYSK